MGVEFNEPVTMRRSGGGRKGSFFGGLIIKLGLAKTEQGAQFVMLGIAVLALICMFLLLPVATQKVHVPTLDSVLLK